MKKIGFFIFFIGCGDIGEGYKWNDSEPAGFYRNFGTRGYDYGRGASYSPFDNGTIITGSQQPVIGQQKNLWAIKTDQKGFSTWDKSFGGDYDDEGYDVISTSDGGFLFIGYTWSYGNEQQIYIIKTDLHGNLKWENTYGGSMWDVGYAGLEIRGGGYIIVGYSNSPGISSGNTDMLLMKIDQNGNQVWIKSYGNEAFPNHEWAYDIEIAIDGFILVGSRDRYENGSKNSLIVKVDDFGNLLWEKEIITEGLINEEAYSISKGLDGFMYICSSINSIDNLENYKPRITKIDGSGNIIWQRKFEANGFDYHQFRANSSIYENSLYIVGTSVSNSIIGYRSNVFVTKIDGSGNIQWSKPHGTSNEDDWGWNIHERPDKNLIVVGSTKSYNASLFDIFLIGINSDGVK